MCVSQHLVSLFVKFLFSINSEQMLFRLTVCTVLHPIELTNIAQQVRAFGDSLQAKADIVGRCSASSEQVCLAWL